MADKYYWDRERGEMYESHSSLNWGLFLQHHSMYSYSQLIGAQYCVCMPYCTHRPTDPHYIVLVAIHIRSTIPGITHTRRICTHIFHTIHILPTTKCVKLTFFYTKQKSTVRRRSLLRTLN